MDKRESLLTAQNLCKTFPAGYAGSFFTKKHITAVDNLNLWLYKGEIFGLVGESGCGKSTAGSMLANILSPSSGEICYRGKEFSQMNRDEIKRARREIQMVFQDPYASLNPKHKIGRMLEELLQIHFKYESKARTRLIDEMLETVGLDAGTGNKYPHELSGGQRQRVNIAAALMLEPAVLVADEAVSALDVSIQSQILNLLKELQTSRQLTYLFISHDLNVVQYISDRIGVMYMGKLVEYGSTEELYKNPRHPYTQALLSAIPSVDDTPRERIILHGEVPNPLSPPAGCAFHTRCFAAAERCRKECPAMKETGNGHFAGCHFV